MMIAAPFAVGNDPHHHRIRRITIEKDCLQWFFDDVRKHDTQELRYVPYMRFVLAERLEAAAPGIGAAIRAIVANRATGGFTAGVEGVTTDPDDFVRFGTAISHLVGPANFDAMSGTYYARFVVEHTDASDSYLRQAYHAMTLHTDGTYVDEPTDYLLMMKFAERNAVGGESRVLHLDDWPELARFAGDPIGQRPMAYASPPSKNVSITVEHPTFFQRDGGWCLSYIDQFAKPANIAEGMYLYELTESMEHSPATVAFPLVVGDLVVLNNLFWAHGRAAFAEHRGLHRELMRIRGRYATP